jgi:hypothetical protein
MIMPKSDPKMSPRFRKSVIVAFHKLLKAARDGADVLLLDIRDKHANNSIQEYNDGNAGDHDTLESSYGQFIDSLAARFDQHANTQGTGQSKMPSESQLQVAEQLLASLLRRRE